MLQQAISLTAACQVINTVPYPEEACHLYQSLRKFLQLPKNNLEVRKIFNIWESYNQFHNILRLLDVLPNFPFTTSETMGDYYL